MPVGNMMPESVRIAQEVTSIAVSFHLEDLREEMISALLMKEFFGKQPDRSLVLVLAVATMNNLAVVIESLADELHKQ